MTIRHKQGYAEQTRKQNRGAGCDGLWKLHSAAGRSAALARGLGGIVFFGFVATFALAPLSITLVSLSPAALATGLSESGPTEAEKRTAALTADMVHSIISVMARHQKRINSPELADKGLTGDVIAGQTREEFARRTGIDPAQLDPSSRDGRVVNGLLSATKEILDETQHVINQKGVGFKGFIPAFAARLVTTRFREKDSSQVFVRLTAPVDLVRNRTARPDSWEHNSIEKIGASGWPKGESVKEITKHKGRDAYRVLVPKYYTQGCMACHGGNRDEIDITGYPKDGRKVGDLGGAISVAVYR